MIDWTRLETDAKYRAEVLTAVSMTPAGRALLAKIAYDADNLSMAESIVLRARLAIIGVEEGLPVVSAVSVFAKLGTALAGKAGKFVPWVKDSISPALSQSWKFISSGGVGRGALIGASAFFATDFAVSRLRGQKPEIEKLYQSGRSLIGATVSSTTSIISLLPFAIVAFGAYQFMRVSK